MKTSYDRYDAPNILRRSWNDQFLECFYWVFVIECWVILLSICVSIVEWFYWSKKFEMPRIHVMSPTSAIAWYRIISSISHLEDNVIRSLLFVRCRDGNFKVLCSSHGPNLLIDKGIHANIRQRRTKSFWHHFYKHPSFQNNHSRSFNVLHPLIASTLSGWHVGILHQMETVGLDTMRWNASYDKPHFTTSIIFPVSIKIFVHIIYYIHFWYFYNIIIIF